MLLKDKMSIDSPGAISAVLADNVGRSTYYLDVEDFEGWLSLFEPNGIYRIHVDSPELRRRMLWLELSRDDLQALLGSINKHLREGSQLTRIPSILFHDEHDGSVHSATAVTIFRTDPAGTSSFFATCYYHDIWVIDGHRLLLHDRSVDLRTRMLGRGSLVPL